MTYELAKQLKDAGFPQEGKGGWIDDKEPKELPSMPDWEGAVYVPTLSELIEACGTVRKRKWVNEIQPLDFAIRHYDNGNIWRAGYMWDKFALDEKYKELWADGSTPEEAVAKLWLELNKKNG